MQKPHSELTRSKMNKTHFQDFEEKSETALLDPRIKKLRKQLAQKNLTGFLVPRADVHRGETVQKCDERLAYISGFTGSAGLAIIGNKSAALFVDSRYTLQAPLQTDINIFEIIDYTPAKIVKFLLENFKKNAKIGYDSWLFSPKEIKQLRKKLESNMELVPTENLLDNIWKDRPKAPTSAIKFLDLKQSGKSASDKIAKLQHYLAAAKCDNIVLTLPESICWLFNMRGRDVPNTPFVLSFAIVPVTGVPTIFLSPDKINHDSLAALDAIAHLSPKYEFTNKLAELKKQKIWLDPASAPSAVFEILEKSDIEIYQKPDPILAQKAKKNDAELAGMKQAHIFDGIAMAKFLHWFDKNAPSGKVSEIDIVTQLENFRRAEKTLFDISFDTISGAGENGAIVHYRVSEKSNRTLKKGEIMLVDSGGQYLSGTTDITRTLYSGAVTSEQKTRYTQVLKGMIAISKLRFPKGTTGAQIDILARQYLWQDGVTYNHGTGHGVGAGLSVHEGPIGISPRVTAELEVGHILSNEPGYYKQGEYGIRIENLIHVVNSEIANDYMEFETLTLAPIDMRLVEQKLLTRDEVTWLNNYHQKVWREIGAKLKGEVKDWLKVATKAI